MLERRFVTQPEENEHMTRARQSYTNPRLQAPIYDWLTANEQSYLERGAASDFSDAIQSAFNECGSSYELCFEAGVYGVATQLVAPSRLRIRGMGATLQALNSLDVAGDGRGAILSSNGFAPTIEGLSFDTNAQNANGIFLASCQAPRILSCGFANSKAGYAGVRGGSILYGEIARSTMQGLGRSVDFQKGWELRSAMAGSPTLTFVSAGAGLGGTITRSAGSWITDGYAVADRIRVELAVNAANNSEFVVTARTATVLTFTAGTLANEGPTAGCVVSIVSGSYYGYHDATIEKCILYGGEGCRLAGYTKVRDTDHEHGVYQPATRNENPLVVGAPLCGAIVLGEELSRSNLAGHRYEFEGIYMELSEGTVGKLRAIAANNQTEIGSSGGLIYGVVGPAAGSTALYNVYGANGTSSGMNLTINRWDYGYEGQLLGSGGHNGLTDLTRIFGANVNTMFKPGTGVQPDEGVRNAGTWNDMCCTKGVGWSVAPNIRHVIQSITPSKTPANLNFAHTRKYYVSGTGTLDTDYFVAGGTGDLELNFAAGSTWTVDSTSGKSLRLIAGANRLFLPGETLLLQVDGAGVIREKGHA